MRRIKKNQMDINLWRIEPVLQKILTQECSKQGFQPYITAGLRIHESVSMGEVWVLPI